MNYYNDNNKNAVRWLEWLIRHDMIPDGRVDSRSIKDVRPEDLKGYSQCHFFAGIGGFPPRSKMGRDWLAAVRLDMEDLGYAFGSSDLCAAGIGSPHKRQRLYWVADSEGAGGRQGKGMGERESQASGGSSPVVCAEPWPDGRGSGSTLGVPDVLPQVDGIPGGMALLHGYGNAVIPGLAEMVMRSWREFRKQEGTLWEE